MDKFLLDSDIIIWHLRGRPEIVKLLKDLQKISVPGCSALSVAEVQQGAKHGEEEKTDQFLDSLGVYPVNKEIACKAGYYVRQYKKKGVTLGLPDAIIAATAAIFDLTLITGNPNHYPMPEVKLCK